MGSSTYAQRKGFDKPNVKSFVVISGIEVIKRKTLAMQALLTR